MVGVRRPRAGPGRASAGRPGGPVRGQANLDGHAVHTAAGARRGPVTGDHGQHVAVAGQDVHAERRHAAGLGPADQGANQGRAHSLPLPGVGHHDADLRHLAGGRGPVGEAGPPGRSAGHRVPDDDAADRGHQGIGVAGRLRRVLPPTRRSPPARSSPRPGPRRRPGSSAQPQARRIRAAVGQTGAKNLWTRVRMDSPAKKQVSAARSSESGRLIVGGDAGRRLASLSSFTDPA